LTRRRALIASGVASLAIAVVLVVLDARMMDSGGPGIVGFEFAGSQERAEEILAEWGDRGTEAAKASLWIDFAYILAYGTFLVLAALATRDLADRRGWRRMAALGVAVVPFAAAAAAFDAIEDVGLLLAVNGHGEDLAPRLAQVCASLKFLLLAVTIAYLLAGLILRFRGRER
jgi:MFS family permease